MSRHKHHWYDRVHWSLFRQREVCREICGCGSARFVWADGDPLRAKELMAFHREAWQI